MFDFEFYFPATGPFLSSGTVTEYKVTIILVMFAHILLEKGLIQYIYLIIRI